MTTRERWQYCLIEVDNNNAGTLRQFFTDRAPVETDLSVTWSGMLAKLGEQGWEMVSVLASEKGRARQTFVFKRQL